MKTRKKIKYLKKANDKVISMCSCEDGLVSYPAQADCPWCGCGWLFTCKSCRKAFTFSECVEIESTYEKIAKEDLKNLLNREIINKEIEDWVFEMKTFLLSAEIGKTYIILDGKLIDSTKRRIEFEGWYAKHKLDNLPQVEAINNIEIIHERLTQQNYWKKHQLEYQDRFGLRILKN